MNQTRQLAALILWGFMIACVSESTGYAAQAQSGTNKPASGPSVTETVAIINGLAACEVKQSVRGPDKDFPHVTVINDTETKAKFELSNGQLTSLEESSRKTNFYNTTKNEMTWVSRKYQYKASAALGNLEPGVAAVGKEITVRCNAARGGCFNTRKTGRIDTNMAGGGDIDEAKKETSQSYSFCSADEASRAAKAFNHLITISGGRKSAF